MMERVVVQLHAGDSPEAVVKKVWRFDTSNIEQYIPCSGMHGGSTATR